MQAPAADSGPAREDPLAHRARPSRTITAVITTAQLRIQQVTATATAAPNRLRGRAVIADRTRPR